MIVAGGSEVFFCLEPQNGGTYPSIDDYCIETIGVAPYPERTVPKILLSISVTTLPVHIKTLMNICIRFHIIFTIDVRIFFNSRIFHI